MCLLKTYGIIIFIVPDGMYDTITFFSNTRKVLLFTSSIDCG